MVNACYYHAYECFLYVMNLTEKLGIHYTWGPQTCVDKLHEQYCRHDGVSVSDALFIAIKLEEHIAEFCKKNGLAPT